jgi:hypothetical protein
MILSLLVPQATAAHRHLVPGPPANQALPCALSTMVAICRGRTGDAGAAAQQGRDDHVRTTRRGVPRVKTGQTIHDRRMTTTLESWTTRAILGACWLEGKRPRSRGVSNDSILNSERDRHYRPESSSCASSSSPRRVELVSYSIAVILSAGRVKVKTIKLWPPTAPDCPSNANPAS